MQADLRTSAKWATRTCWTCKLEEMRSTGGGGFLLKQYVFSRDCPGGLERLEKMQMVVRAGRLAHRDQLAHVVNRASMDRRECLANRASFVSSASRCNVADNARIIF